MAMLFSTKKAAVKPVETVNRSLEALSHIFAEAEKVMPIASVNDLIAKGQKLVCAPNIIKEAVAEDTAHQQMIELMATVKASKSLSSKL